ncbi:MAG: hypothetical protein MRJ52_10795 [Nitrosomonas sp.]|nr:hypothetical protein [Nitrosomonas sp.]
MTDCTQRSFDFPAVKKRVVEVNFEAVRRAGLAAKSCVTVVWQKRMHGMFCKPWHIT